MVDLDKIDKQLLNLLQDNAKITHKEIADKLYLTRTPIFDRIKKLERRGVIQSYITLLNPKKVNRGLGVLCFISLKEHGLEAVNDFQKAVESNTKVMECFHVAGNFDFLLKVMVKDMEEYQYFVLNELSSIENITHVQSSFVLGELKKESKFVLK